MTVSRSRPATLLVALAAAVLALSPLAAPQADATTPAKRVTHWTKASSATITPGVTMYTAGAQCTSNFVFTDKRGGVYLGYAAHCAGKGEATDTNGCNVDSVPLDTRVTFVRGGSIASRGTTLGRGKLAYSSWTAMHQAGTSDANTCAYNDLALVKVAHQDIKKVNPSVPFWGGPTGIDADGTQAGDRVWTYGNSSLRAGVSVLSPHTGVSLGDTRADGGWTHPLYTVSPGIPGDSGSGFLSSAGKAIGTLSTIGLAPLPASNNIGDLAKELAFARAHSGIPGLKLAQGTEKFDPVL